MIESELINVYYSPNKYDTYFVQGCEKINVNDEATDMGILIFATTFQLHS